MEAAVPERVELPAGAVDDAVPGAARAEEAPAGPVVDPKDAAARAATDELLPQIEGRSPDVDPDAVLAQAAGARAIPEDTATGIMDAATALRGGGHTVASWEKSIKELTKGKANAEFFGRTVKYRGQEMTLRDALRDAGIGALTGSARGFGPLDSMLKVINGAATPKISPDSIGAALEKAQPGLTAQLDLADIMQKLVGADEAGRKAVLQEAIGARTGEKYESFDKAIAGAVDGKIEASMMRSMLRALGINTRATTPHGMRKVLAEKGLTRWEELQNSIMTAAESVDRHGLPDDAVEAAKEVDAPAALEAMTIHYQTKVEELGFDPAVMAPMKEGGTVVGEAVHDAIQAFGRRVKGAEMSEAYDNTMMQDLWGATMRSAARYANQNRMSGARRGDWLYERVLKAVDLTEDYARSVGSMPRIATRDAEVPDPVFVSLGQILRAADPAAVKAALFSPDMAPIAREGAKITRYNYGISLYPTAMGDAVHHAVKAVKTGRLGPEVEAELVDLLTAKHRGTKNTWAQSSAGVAAIKQWAAAVADPGFLRHMVQLDGDQGPVAVAIAQQAAEGIITPMTERIIKALNENADRGAIQTVIDKAREEAVAVTRGVDGKATFLADEVLRRLDNGFLNGVLGREGAKIVKGDKRMERTVAPKGQPEPAVTRGEVAAAKRETGADYVDDVAEDVELAAERGDIAPDDTAKLELYMAMLAEKTGAGQLFDRIGVAVSGRYGMPDAKPVALIVEGRTRAASAEYAEAISRWIHGGRQRLAGAGMPGLRERLAAELGVPKVDYATISSKLRQWWHALAQADGTLTGDELRAALVKGSDGVNPLSEGEAQMASEFKALIDRVFDESSSGPFVRSGIETADLVRTLRSHGFEDGTPLGALTPDAGESLAWQSGTWRDFELTEDVDPLDVLQGYFGALSASSVRPSVGAEMSLHFDHRAAGLTPAQARAEGWMKIDTLDARGDGLARYLDPDSYFPPEIRKQMTYLENFLQSSRSFGNSGIRGQIISTYKTILHVLKSSATIWRPGHHVASVLGEVSMLVMAGVNPLQSLRSFGVLRAAGQMLDADMSVLGKMDSLANGRALDPRFANIADGRGVQLTVNGQQVQLTNAEIWTAALRHEVAMTHTATRDIVDAPSVRFEKSEWRNPFAAVDTRLGQFSATRDNVTRIGHFIDALEKGTYRSLDEAYRRAASKVHDYHPTMGTLSAFEQKYARLAFYFYTWVKQAASRVIRTALDQPGLFMLPFKAQYNAAEAAGFDPASFGQPMPTNPDVLDEAYGEDGYPDYYQTGLLGPTFQAGDSPIDGGEGNLWGFSLSTPQIDTLTTAFKGIDTDPEDPLGGVYGAIGAPLGMLAGAASPVISVPLQLGGVDMTGFGAPEGSREVNEMLLRSTGAPGALAGALPGYNDVFDPVAPPAARKSLEAQARENAGYEAEQAEADGDDVRRLLNYLTGTKVTNYSKG
jgi:post-segregation antitoxin (ccd killing protein)